MRLRVRHGASAQLVADIVDLTTVRAIAVTNPKLCKNLGEIEEVISEESYSVQSLVDFASGSFDIPQLKRDIP
jgi:hypothetical protein